MTPMTSAAARPADPSGFDAARAVRPVARGRFAADVDPEWSIAGRTNGGYLLALMARAAGTQAGGWAVPAGVPAPSLSPTPPGPAELVVTTLRTGRRSSVHRVELWSADGEP